MIEYVLICWENHNRVYSYDTDDKGFEIELMTIHRLIVTIDNFEDIFCIPQSHTYEFICGSVEF